MTLFIIESPGKIKTISSILSRDYIVKASFGHVFDIGTDSNIDIKNNYAIKYQPIKGKEKVIAEFKSLANKCDEILIATDGDREGEAIGWNIANEIFKNKKVKRVIYNEITKQAILKAIANPTTLNEALYRSQQARSVLDLLVGFKVSPILWKKVCKGTSAGRVQSIGLMLMVERQKEIDAFIIREYWDITGKFKFNKIEFKAQYKSANELQNETETNEIVAEINKAKFWKIKSVDKTEKSRSPLPIFNTSSLQQFCSSTFGWDGKRTMGLAQSLYEGIQIKSNHIGLITYHRTDSVNISTEAIDSARSFIKTSCGQDYLPKSPIIYKSKNKNAQEAHEGIRPSHLEYTLEEIKQYLNDDEFKLYQAIYYRFVSCQMTNAKFNTTKVIIISDNNQTFTTSGQVLVFDGFLKMWPYSESSTEEKLPELSENDKIELLKIEPKQHFTKPPAHYNTASLVKKMEEESVGRPSTYASIVDTLIRRNYITKDGKSFVPTELGKKICDFLQANFKELMNINYTARIEDQLDDIALDKKVWYEVVDEFYTELQKRIVVAKDIKKELDVSDHVCPTCKTYKLVKRFGKFGSFYGCSNYPDCTGSYQIGKDDEPILKEKKEHQYLENHKCACGAPLVIRTSFKTQKQFAGCSTFPKCKGIYTLEGEKIEFKSKFEKFKKKKKE